MGRFGNDLKSDVLKVGHHGSIPSTTEALLAMIQPELAVVLVGEGNKFPHQSEVIMDGLLHYNVQIHRTDHSGALWLIADGRTYWQKKWH